ncbi:MAG: AAA family ATPase [Muribaculaceae bacterium]|nr:AAA family ATPase [Muribaculaceae bacterium]
MENIINNDCLGAFIPNTQLSLDELPHNPAKTPDDIPRCPSIKLPSHEQRQAELIARRKAKAERRGIPVDNQGYPLPMSSLRTFTPIPMGMFVGLPANQWVYDALRRPNPKSLWHNLWYEGELCCLFADTNVGKSIYAIQIANEVARDNTVLYFDFEMSDKQLQMRYTDPETLATYQFNDGFYRLEFDSENSKTDTADIAQVMRNIEQAAWALDADAIIIDNISWLCNRAESGDAAGELMQLLIDLKRRSSLSILVLAHTPKRNIYAPINQNSLAGSKRLANFMDSMFAIGIDYTRRPYGRYIKQIKVRSSEMLYGDTNVIRASLVKEGCNITMRHDGFAAERDLLLQPDRLDIERGDAMVDSVDPVSEAIADRIARGKTYREIAAELGVSTKTVCRVARREHAQMTIETPPPPAD